VPISENRFSAVLGVQLAHVGGMFLSVLSDDASRIEPMMKIARCALTARCNYFKARKQFPAAWLKSSTTKPK
jgi:hypothetical protein